MSRLVSKTTARRAVRVEPDRKSNCVMHSVLFFYDAVKERTNGYGNYNDDRTRCKTYGRFEKYKRIARVMCARNTVNLIVPG